ncbi:unnamed protein product [Acanthoscelides obtectus]|uniref:Uncharacterized protein n=1 Tax=Acanthoscelides obtectus TaxID=200917 RepID=A0A9P0MI62_ACAOB|nr:unnamed protein product [Acanthoscelides obtectus]CAK1670667.1 hypothetical protein AOBTE_LOCUS27746 [Acanthoscelides obtectus]
MSSIVVEAFDTCFSDHLGIAFHFNLKTLKPVRKRINYRPVTDEGLFKLYSKIETVDWIFLSDISLPLTTKLERFMNILTNNVAECLPIKSRLVSEGCRNKINWFDHELAHMRETLELITQINKDNPQVVSKKEINVFKSKYRSEIRIRKKNAHDKFIRRASDKQAAMWNEGWTGQRPGGVATCCRCRFRGLTRPDEDLISWLAFSWNL